MPLITLADLKVYLRLDATDASEDADLQDSIAAATRLIELRTGRVVDIASRPSTSAAAPFAEADLPLVRRAAMKLVGDWYENRENSTDSRLVELPNGVSRMIEPLVAYIDRGGPPA